MSKNSSSHRFWSPAHIKGANAQWDPLAGIGAFARAWALEHRVVYLTTGIQAEDSFADDEFNPGVAGLIASLRMLDAMESGKPITMYINSPGGDVHSGLALIQTMRDLRSPVTTFVIQLAASMAAVVAVSGAKRVAYPAARWLLHRDFVPHAEGDYRDLEIAAKETKIVDKSADQVILNFTKIRSDQLEQMQAKDYWLGVREALRFGIIDDVIAPRQGPDMKHWLPGKLIAKEQKREDSR